MTELRHHKMKHLFKQVYHWLMPHFCTLCDTPTQTDLDICKECLFLLPWVQSYCRICAIPITDTHKNICGLCIQKRPPFHQTITLWHYEWPVSHMMTQLKFHRKLYFARLFGRFLADKIQTNYKNDRLPEVVIPVPLHRKRLRERGFNQALEITREIKRYIPICIDYHCVRKTKHTPPQTTLPAKERHHNIKNAFEMAPLFHYQHIALLDDVVTTGSTITELSYLFQQAGCKRVDIWCLARSTINN